MNPWILFGVAWLGSWIFIAILFFIWVKLSTRLLKGRYKEENDRGRPIKDLIKSRGINKGGIRGKGFGVEENTTTTSSIPTSPISSIPTSSIPTSPTSSVPNSEQGARGDSETESTNLFNGQGIYKPTNSFIPTRDAESFKRDFHEPTPSRKLSFFERRWKKE